MTDKIVLLVSPGEHGRFEIREQSVSEPGEGQILIHHQAIGTNFLDVYHRKGIYPLPTYPAVIGAEAAGVVEAVGSGVSDFRAGDRVAYAGPPVGAYASLRIIETKRVVKLSDSISMKTAASSLLKAMTAHMLLEKTFMVKAGDVVLVHAAAGGLGSILTRGAKARGAVVIGTVGSEEKAVLARAAGANHLIVGRDADLVSEVKALTEGNGVDVVYDGIGGDVLLKSIHSVRPFGVVVTIGQAAGPIPPVAVENLRPGKFLAHPSIMAWCADVGRHRETAIAALRDIEAGIVSQVDSKYRLDEVAAAHVRMESGRSSGSILLMP
ncbi:quinone oxidoreductase [Shinella sp. JR1-6]|uniref:quinone oxidoreductase family protein n=1 Tax=Shinella sp. JR1-6 TaxID=2527671 RepID=UPI00102D550E|nr:quinone oxidoreductase [Shinella sp. JR1-6]TAA55551.1 quinone oxidoreductase [Shinella sp. JR1-6]